MDLNLSPDDVAFRDRVRAFLATELPADIRERTLSGTRFEAGDVRRWQRILHDHGWGAVHWPAEFGGLQSTPIQQYLFELECALAGAPIQLAFGLRMLGPVLMRYGSPVQQQRFLPRILSGEDWWCQGYSEPGAGSDLASLKTTAVQNGDHYVVNGQKCWNTLGQFADWIFCLVRTDGTAKPQRGISLLLIDMKTPGITVRPTVLLDGTPEVNEIWLQDVRVPVENRIGEENQGWTYAKFLLGHERANIAGIGASKRELLRLKRLAARQRRGGQPVIDDPDFRRRLARVEIDLLALEYTNLRMLSAPANSPSAGIAASILKIRGSEIRQALSELLVEALGTAALRFAAHPVADAADAEDDGSAGLTAAYLNLRKLSIFGGSNEIQKNIISQTLIGL
ncbi:MAG: acyl-CoA dehydrogenase family protein [Proteobacteria bacterium]|nr:acyl-CoA dehydrogenase family protein [Pseudomonadota bacterium]